MLIWVLCFNCYYNYPTIDNKKNNKDKKNKLLNSIDNKALKIRIKKFLSRKKDIIKILKRNSLSEFKKFIKENNITLKKLNNKNFDILISAIECDVSNEIISYIIKQVNYNTLNYCFQCKSNEYKYSFNENIPLFTAIAKNKFDIANLLLQNKANMCFDCNIFEYLNYHDLMNKDNLKFILKNEIDTNSKVSKDSPFQKSFNNFISVNGIKIFYRKFQEIICQWISCGKNDLLEVIFKYYILKHFDELNNININRYTYIEKPLFETLIQKALEFRNYEILKYFIKESDDKEEDILDIIFDVLEYRNSDGRRNYYNYYYNAKPKNKKIEFLNSIDNEELKIKIERFLSRKNDIFKILKRNNLTEFQNFINENSITLRSLNTKKFDILITAIECDVSHEIISYIIDQVNYDTLDYCFNNKNNEFELDFCFNNKNNEFELDYCFNNKNNEFEYCFEKNIPLFTAVAKNKFEIANLLLQNKANMCFDNNNIFKFLNDNNVLNKENLKFILNNGIKIDNDLLVKEIFQWVSYSRKNLLEPIIKYYVINHFDELRGVKIITDIFGREKKPFFEILFQKLIDSKDYGILEFFIINSGDKEKEILNIISDIFDSNYNNKIKKIKFLNLIDNDDLKIKIKKVLLVREDIIEILKRNDFYEFLLYTSRSQVILKNLNNKNFDILITAIECDVSNDIINYIINEVDYDTLNYCFHGEDNMYKYTFNNNVPLFIGHTGSAKETPYRSTLRDPRGKAEPTTGAGHCKSSQTRLTQWDSYSVRNIENIESIPT
ncbi:hypothetical protein H8356DRAFT_1436267 [Neocallimastix lanati (nom. inval.)]|nr:hypothetical protein H8356DRAFT_1436267 [Neocallimastix sp. JGI-2020a]